MDNESLNSLAGGVSGFADSFLAGMKEKRDREATASKFAAYMELQREMQGNKTVSGQELMDYGLTMGIAPEQLKPLDLGKKYNITLGKTWVDNLNAQKITGVKEGGAKERANIAANAKKATAGGVNRNLSFKPENASAKALNDALVGAGYAPGTKLGAIKDKGKLEAIGKSYLEGMGGSITAAGQQDYLEASLPYTVKEEPGFWGTNIGVEAQPGWRSKVKTVETTPPVTAPAAPSIPTAGGSPMPTAAPSPEAVGSNRKAVRNAYLKKLGLPPEP